VVDAVVATRVAETPASLSSSRPAPTEIAAAIASATIKPSWITPTPINRMSRSPAVIPSATPNMSSTARRERCPRVAPSETIADTGANTGLGCFNSLVAMSHASAAATAV
jgi:hypothetical protein